MTLLLLLRRFWPYIAAALIVGGFVWWIADMRSDLAATRASLAQTQLDLKTEKLARERDVAGLTTLASGLSKAVVDTKHDATILSETIDVQNPHPASTGLAELMRRLREADTAPGGHTAATGPRSAPGGGS